MIYPPVTEARNIKVVLSVSEAQALIELLHASGAQAEGDRSGWAFPTDLEGALDMVASAVEDHTNRIDHMQKIAADPATQYVKRAEIERALEVCAQHNLTPARIFVIDGEASYITSDLRDVEKALHDLISPPPLPDQLIAARNAISTAVSQTFKRELTVSRAMQHQE